MSAHLGHADAHDTPSEHELDASDRFLSSIAAGAMPTDAVGPDPLTELLRAASGPAGAGELAGSEQFVAAVSAKETSTRRGATPAVFVGKAVAAKVAVIAAVTVLGIASAGAATGVILHVANDDAPQPVVTVDDPDASPLETPVDRLRVDGSRDARGSGAAADPVRVRTCAAAITPTGLEQLARAAGAASTTTDEYCRGTATIADPDRPEVAASGADESSSTDGPSSRTSPPSDQDGRAADPGPPAGAGGSGNGGGNSSGGNNSGSGTPGTPNSNANPKSGNGATNGGGNAGGANTGSPNGGNQGGNSTPGTPNTNANPKAGDGAANRSGGSTGAGSTAPVVDPATRRGPAADAAPGDRRGPATATPQGTDDRPDRLR